MGMLNPENWPLSQKGNTMGHEHRLYTWQYWISLLDSLTWWEDACWKQKLGSLAAHFCHDILSLSDWSLLPLWQELLISLKVDSWPALIVIAGKELLDVLSSLDAELSACSGWLPNVNSLDFINNPVKSRPYQCKTPDELVWPNVGLHALKSTPKNHIFLEHESWLCDILHILELMNATKVGEDMEDQVI